MIKNPPANAGEASLIPGSGRSLEEEMATHSKYSYLEKFHGQRSSMGYSPKGYKELDLSEHDNTTKTYIYNRLLR